MFFEVDVYIDNFLSIKDKVNMILFHGEARSDFFRGTVQPGAVDTQMANDEGEWTLSARYMIEGMDNNGKKTKIFIQNNGKNINEEMVTKPKMFTDNEELLWIESVDLVGHISDIEGGIRINLEEVSK